jgi:hypothetical protein
MHLKWPHSGDHSRGQLWAKRVGMTWSPTDLLPSGELGWTPISPSKIIIYKLRDWQHSWCFCDFTHECWTIWELLWLNCCKNFVSWLGFLLPYSNTLRVTRSAAPSTLDSSSTVPAHLGKKGKEFEFSQLPLKVEFLECSAKGGRGDAGSADIQDLEKWLAKIAWRAAPSTAVDLCDWQFWKKGCGHLELIKKR